MKFWFPRSLLALTLTIAVAAPAAAKPWKEKKGKESHRNVPSHVSWDRDRGYERNDRFSRYERTRYERARADRARYERARYERARYERARLEQARHERARYERARLEQARYERARYERARLERERYERARYERARLERARRERMAQIIRARNEECRREFTRDVRRNPHGKVVPVARGRGRDVRSDGGRFDCGYGNDRPRTVRRDPREWPPPIARDDRMRRDRRAEDIRRSANPCADGYPRGGNPRDDYPVDRGGSDAGAGRRNSDIWVHRVFQGDDGYPRDDRMDRNNRRRSDDCDLEDARDWLRGVQIGTGIPGQGRNLVGSNPAARGVAQRALRILQSSP